MRLFGLIGYPLGHSFSASYFNQKFHEEGIDARYLNFPLEQVGEFRDLVDGEPELAGLNVTVPYKQEIIPYLDHLNDSAANIQAVNTITFRRDRDRLQLLGDNTDVIGFRRSLEEHLHKGHGEALVLGTGGASRAVLYVLDQLGIPGTLVSRTPGDQRITYGQLDEDRIARSTLIINTTPLGMHPREDTFPLLPYHAMGPGHLLFDLVYNPEKTAFLAKGEEYGARIVNGYDMLIYQAEASWEIWNAAYPNERQLL
jgi:shikimate dehydrogenase